MYARVLTFFSAMVAVAAVNPWISELSSLLDNCPVKKESGFVSALSECARIRTLLAIDVILDEDVIPIYDGLELVKYGYVKNLQNSTIDYSTLSLRYVNYRAIDFIKGDYLSKNFSHFSLLFTRVRKYLCQKCTQK